jgi:hypothetical protein
MKQTRFGDFETLISSDGISRSLNNHFANHASTTVGLAVVVVGASFREGFFP